MHQRVDDPLLTSAETQRLAHPLLLEQQVREDSAPPRGAGRPLEHLIERRERIGELAERDRALGGPAAEPDGGGPVFRAPEVMREERRAVVHPVGVRGLQRASDRPVEHLALVSDQAVVADLLREGVRETIADRRSGRGPLDQTRRFEGGDGRAEIHVGGYDLCQKRVIELAADHRCDPHDLECLRMQVVEPRANHALDGIRQRERCPRPSRTSPRRRGP